MPVTLTHFLIALGASLVAVLVAIVVVHLLVLAAARRWAAARDLARYARVPFRLFLLFVGLSGLAASQRPEGVDPTWWNGIRLALRLASIGSGAWLLASALLFLEDLGLRRYSTDTRDHAEEAGGRRSRTGPAGTPSFSAPSSWTLTGASTWVRCATSSTGSSTAPTCGTAVPRCCR